jgi:hypothetical protein
MELAECSGNLHFGVGGKSPALADFGGAMELEMELAPGSRAAIAQALTRIGNLKP